MNAMWIGPAAWQTDADPVSQHPFLFRRDVVLPSPVDEAVLDITAHARYVLFINGRFVNAGPARCYPNRQLVDTVPIAPYLRIGHNAIAVYLMSSTGVTGYSVTTRPGLYIHSRIRIGGHLQAVVSDASWFVRVTDWISSEGFLTSLPTGTQEHLDLSHRPANVLDGSLEGFAPVRVLGPFGTPPFLTLEPRPIPLLHERPITPHLHYVGRCAPHPWPISGNLARQFQAAEVTGSFCNPTPADEILLDTQKANVITLDFAKTRFIRPGFEVMEGHPYCRVELYYDIACAERPTVMRGFNSAREGFCDSVNAPQAGDHFATLHPRGFRFMTLRLSGNGHCRLRMACRSVDYPFADLKSPVARDPVLQAIWQTSAETLRSASNDVFVDTCSRENVLWTLDACLSGKAACDTFGEHKLWRRCLSLISQGIDQAGIPHAVVPSQDSFMILFDQTLYFVISCQDYVKATGDASLAVEVRPAIERFLTLCLKQITSEGLFVPPAYSWHFVDWAPMVKRAYSFPINALLVLALEAAATLTPDKKGSVFLQTADSLKAALLRFWDERENCYRNHIEPTVAIEQESTFNAPKPEDTLPHGLHTNALALRCRLGSPVQQSQAAAWMARQLERPFGPHNHFGPGWCELILNPLFDYGFGPQALDFIRRIYGRLLETGAPTWPEGFDPHPYNTAHGWGAVVNCILAKRVHGHE